MGLSLSHGDDMDFLITFRVANGHDGSSQEASGVETLFPVKAIILNSKNRAIKYLLGIRKVEAMFLDVC